MHLDKINWRNLIIDPYRYNWIALEKDYCTTRYPEIKVLLVVHTAPNHFEARQALRWMYGDKFYSQVLYLSNLMQSSD